MILELVEVDRPKTLGESVSQFFARPPQPVLRFYTGFRTEIANGRKHLLFTVRNGVPLPLLYGIYIKADADYIEKTDHIGPFSTDNWRLTLDNAEPIEVEIRVGLVPFEILTDKVQVTI